MSLGTNKELKADVLIVGGGMAGLWAAIGASDVSKKVLLVDKAHIGRSGCAAFAAGIYFLPFPGEDKALWMEEIVQNVKAKTNSIAADFEELDLSGFSTIDEQLEFLEHHDRVNSMFIM